MTKLARTVDAVLAVFLIALIFTFGFMTIYPNIRTLYDSARLMRKLQGYLPEDYDALDMLSARKSSFEAAFTQCLWKTNELGYLNASFQFALGKNIINAGATNMLRLPNGFFYDMQPYIDSSPRTDEIIRFAGELDVPLLFLYEHPTIYADSALEGGYATLDKGDEMSDEIVGKTRAAGIETIDSRDVLAGLPAREITMATDQHWTTYAELLVAKTVAEELGSELGLDAGLLDISLFDSETFPAKFVGRYGQRVGTDNVPADDLTVFWPTYPTDIARYTLHNGRVTETQGAFRDSIIRWEYLSEDSPIDGGYKAYGLTENYEHFHNESAPDVTILVFKDSYSAPVSAFLSLVARDVYAVDMRKTDKRAMEFVEEWDPDCVVVGFSRQMIVGKSSSLYKN